MANSGQAGSLTLTLHFSSTLTAHAQRVQSPAEAYKEVQLRRPGCQTKNHLVTSRPHSSQLLVNYLLHRCDEMFKKLKQKINEEQSPQRNAQSPQQAQVGCCVAGS